MEIAQRCISKSTWTLGAPWRPEPWPGMRAPEALTPTELSTIEQCVKQGLGIQALQPQDASESGISGHNHIQIVGGAEGVARPHVDSAKICDYAAVLYLHPNPPTPPLWGPRFIASKEKGDNPMEISVHVITKV